MTDRARSTLVVQNPDQGFKTDGKVVYPGDFVAVWGVYREVWDFQTYNEHRQEHEKVEEETGLYYLTEAHADEAAKGLKEDEDDRHTLRHFVQVQVAVMCRDGTFRVLGPHQVVKTPRQQVQAKLDAAGITTEDLVLLGLRPS